MDRQAILHQLGFLLVTQFNTVIILGLSSDFAHLPTGAGFCNHPQHVIHCPIHHHWNHHDQLKYIEIIEIPMNWNHQDHWCYHFSDTIRKWWLMILIDDINWWYWLMITIEGKESWSWWDTPFPSGYQLIHIWMDATTHFHPFPPRLDATSSLSLRATIQNPMPTPWTPSSTVSGPASTTRKVLLESASTPCCDGFFLEIYYDLLLFDVVKTRDRHGILMGWKWI